MQDQTDQLWASVSHDAGSMLKSFMEVLRVSVTHFSPPIKVHSSILQYCPFHYTNCSSKHWFTTSFLQPTAIIAYVISLHSCSSKFVKPVLNWAHVCSPNILQTVRRTMIRFLIQLLVHQTWFTQFSELYFVLNWLVMRCELQPELGADVQQTA